MKIDGAVLSLSMKGIMNLKWSKGQNLGILKVTSKLQFTNNKVLPTKKITLKLNFNCR